MWEMWAALVAALALAFGLARHDPKKFDPFSAGILVVLWPVIGGMFGWDFALVAAQIGLKSALDPTALSKAVSAIKAVELPDGTSTAALGAALGLQIIKSFVPPKD